MMGKYLKWKIFKKNNRLQSADICVLNVTYHFTKIYNVINNV